MIFIIPHILFGAIYHNFKLEFWMIIILFLRSSANIWLWVDCVWILINIFLWHYKRHLYIHTLFQMSPYHVVCIFVTYIWIMCYGAICILHKIKLNCITNYGLCVFFVNMKFCYLSSLNPLKIIWTMICIVMRITSS